MTIRKLKLYSKLTLLGLAVLIALVFMISNSGRVTIKFFAWEIWQAPVFALIISSAGMGATLAIFSRTIVNLFKELRQLHKEKLDRQALRRQINKQMESDPLKKESSQ